MRAFRIVAASSEEADDGRADPGHAGGNDRPARAGTLSKADYTEVIEPALREAVKVFDDLDEVDEATRWVAG